MPSDDWLKSSFRESSASLVNSTSGGCPVGVRCPAKYKRAPRARTTAPIAITTTVTVRRTAAALRNHAGKQFSRYLRKHNHAEDHNRRYQEQKNADRAAALTGPIRPVELNESDNQQHD